MRYGLIFALLLAAAPLCAEEWLDFNARDVGFGGMGTTFGRDATGGYYNPANVSRRPWESSEFASFDIDLPLGVSAGLHGTSFNNIFTTVDLANDLFDRFQDGAFDVSSGSISNEDLKFAIGVFDALDALNSLNGEGLYVGSSVGLAARLELPVLPRAGVALHVGGFGMGAITPIVDLQSLMNYRLTDESGAQWDALVSAAAANSGGAPTPTSAEAQAFSSALQAGGYPQAQADALAGLCEEAGINFGGAGADVLLQFLLNTRNGTGQSLESGANPLEGNRSGFLARGLSTYEIGVTFSTGLPIPLVSKWLAVGATLKFYQASVFNQLLLVQDLDKDGIRDSLTALRESIQDAYAFNGSASRNSLGLDLGLVFTPQIPFLDTLAVSFAMRNVWAPEFRWKNLYPGEPLLVRFDPQARLGASYTFFAPYLPLTIGVEGDLNRVSSDILPGYSTQFIRAGLAFDPSWKGLGFSLRVGALKNVGDAGEKITLTAGTGVSLFFVRLDVGAQVTLGSVEFGPAADNRMLPQRAALFAQLQVRIDW